MGLGRYGKVCAMPVAITVMMESLSSAQSRTLLSARMTARIPFIDLILGILGHWRSRGVETLVKESGIQAW
jgi:hypothetical protein